MPKNTQNNVLYLVLFIFFIITMFIVVNIPEIRVEALGFFGLSFATLLGLSKPKKTSQSEKRLLYLVAAVSAINVYFMLSVPEYFQLGFIYIVLAAAIGLGVMRKDK